MERLLKATVNSWNGLRFAMQSEAAIREELAVLVVAVPVSLVLAHDAWRRLLLIGVVVLLIVIELLNTAIEKLSDRVTPALDTQIGHVKDMGSAAVGLTILLALAIWLLALAEWLGWL